MGSWNPFDNYMYCRITPECSIRVFWFGPSNALECFSCVAILFFVSDHGLKVIPFRRTCFLKMRSRCSLLWLQHCIFVCLSGTSSLVIFDCGYYIYMHSVVFSAMMFAARCCHIAATALHTFCTITKAVFLDEWKMIEVGSLSILAVLAWYWISLGIRNTVILFGKKMLECLQYGSRCSLATKDLQGQIHNRRFRRRLQIQIRHLVSKAYRRFARQERENRKLHVRMFKWILYATVLCTWFVCAASVLLGFVLLSFYSCAALYLLHACTLLDPWVLILSLCAPFAQRLGWEMFRSVFETFRMFMRTDCPRCMQPKTSWCLLQPCMPHPVAQPLRWLILLRILMALVPESASLGTFLDHDLQIVSLLASVLGYFCVNYELHTTHLCCRTLSAFLASCIMCPMLGSASYEGTLRARFLFVSVIICLTWYLPSLGRSYLASAPKRSLPSDTNNSPQTFRNGEFRCYINASLQILFSLVLIRERLHAIAQTTPARTRVALRAASQTHRCLESISDDIGAVSNEELLAATLEATEGSSCDMGIFLISFCSIFIVVSSKTRMSFSCLCCKSSRHLLWPVLCLQRTMNYRRSPCVTHSELSTM